MERKYISEARYNKVPRRASRKRTVKKNTSASLKSKNTTKKKSIKTKKYKLNKSKVIKLISCIALIILIAVLSRVLIKKEGSSFVSFFKWRTC